MSEKTVVLVVSRRGITLGMLLALVKHPSIEVTGVFDDIDLTELPCWGKVEVFVPCGISGNILRDVLAGNNVKWVHSFYAGVEKLIIPEITQSDIPFTCSKGSSNEGLTDFTISSILYFHRDLETLIENKASKIWSMTVTPRLRGMRIGLLGYGTIGCDIAKAAKMGFGLEVVAIKRRLMGGVVDFADEIHVTSELHTILPTLDFLVMALPSTPDTKEIIGEAEIRLMKPSAVLVNVGRGASLDEEALSRALHEGRLKGAALDVFKVEPLPQDSVLWTTPRLLISPHKACFSEALLRYVVEIFEQNVDLYLLGAPLLNLVDKVVGY